MNVINANLHFKLSVQQTEVDRELRTAGSKDTDELIEELPRLLNYAYFKCLVPRYCG